MTTWRAPVATTADQRRRQSIRYAAAGVAALTAVLYLLIGFVVLHVVDESPDAPPLLDFGLMAGAAFGLGALLLVTMDQRILWILGALLQAAVIVMYVVVGQERTPAFEVWGVTIKVLQAIQLGALLYLAIRQPERVTSPPPR